VGYKILLADDSVTVQKIITLTFSDEGADVLAVNNGDEAINRLQYMRPALVMADVSIPGKNGYEICEFVKNHPEMKDTPVVLLVPAFEPFDEERARRIGADQHLTKPFQSIRTLIATVKNLIDANPPKFTTGSMNPTGSLTRTAEPERPAMTAEPEAETEVETVQAEPEAAEATPSYVDAPATQPFPHESPKEVFFESGADILSAATDEVQEVKMPDTLIEEDEDVELPDTLIDIESEQEVLVEAESEPIADAVTEPNVQIVGEEAETEPSPVQIEKAPAPPIAVQNNLNADVDHVLDLDDVLDWPPAPIPEPSIESSQVIVPQAPSFTPSPTESSIPQSVIDEIVNRVVAQLSEKLTANLAAQLAPEVAELVKQQTQSGAATMPPPVSTESDSLLDLD